jgi:menaquinol-cytochrome c reductase cytochrome b/c subunit
MARLAESKFRMLALGVCVVASVAFALALLPAGSAMPAANISRAARGKVVIVNIKAPNWVASAGSRELDKWYFGRRVASEAGCSACHRIGESGNRGPGIALTRIGDLLNVRELENVLLDAPAPMPSFRSLPRNKLRPLVLFLSLLRDGRRGPKASSTKNSAI